MENTKKIAVMSGKGGVGKTTIAVNLAVSLSAEGYKVGLLDLDLHGPNVQRMLGVSLPPSEGEKIVPAKYGSSLKVFSLAMILQEGAPVIWRGPLKHKAIEQLANDVEWGEIDYLVCDLPPGTGDEALSTFQVIKPDGVVIVSTPQKVAGDDVRRAMNFVKRLGGKVIGIVENMSYLVCPNCGEKIFVFGKGETEKIAQEFNVSLLARIPMDPDIVSLSDEGKPIVVYKRGTSIEEEFRKIVEKILSL
ncbi:Mrp/NBP35 family ATP-binding protein [Thermotoga sp. KOL6]|uniref:Mrp/NBP35 family ATP-binding protein n=1 Tax=Thermotoga sp. KOL6 TaxID=126741 RepID=UPI000C788121|nr:Mrp/NBP35 family ATP-binding protein [Thermotoga sp. KOL6]PLV60498.1 ATP-binding protein [Thermotoga sp. KOL6]